MSIKSIAKSAKNNIKKKGFSNESLAWIAIVVMLIIAIFQMVDADYESINSELIKTNEKFSSMEKEMQKLRKKTESMRQEINEQTIYIDRLKRHLLFIYTRADLSSGEQWRNSLIENKNWAQRDLLINKTN